MDELVIKARKKQPGLIVVDRAVHGKNQNSFRNSCQFNFTKKKN